MMLNITTKYEVKHSKMPFNLPRNIVINPYNKTQSDALIPQIYFWNRTLHVSDSSSVHHQEFFTVHTAMVYVITGFADSLRKGSGRNWFGFAACLSVFSDSLRAGSGRNWFSSAAAEPN